MNDARAMHCKAFNCPAYGEEREGWHFCAQRCNEVPMCMDSQDDSCEKCNRQTTKHCLFALEFLMLEQK